MKFKDGYMISSGKPVNEYNDCAVRHVLLRQGVLGNKVKIMLDWDPKGKQVPTTLPDLVANYNSRPQGGRGVDSASSVGPGNIIFAPRLEF